MTEDKKFHHGNLKDELIEVTIRFITLQKDTNISIREIANSLGVTHAAVYRHFESKTELLAAVATNGYLLLTKHLEDELEKVKNLRPRPLLAGVLNAYIDFAIANEGYYRILFDREIVKRNDEELQKAITQSRLPIQYAIEKASKKGALKNTLIIDTLSTDILAFLHGYVVLIIDGLASDNANPSQLPKLSKQNYINLIINSIID
jgi:AcrR family transcriptional regulator